MSSSPSAFSTAINALVAVAKADLAKEILPLIVNFLNAIVANPSQLNVMAQLAKLQVDVMAALPGLGQEELKALAQILSAEATSLLTPAAPAA